MLITFFISSPSVLLMVWAECKNCGKETERHSKDLCITCYKKLLWKPKKKICKRCGKERALHAKKLCPGCYNFVFHLDKTKTQNYRKYHNVSLELYKKITKNCAICGFDKIVDLHHLDENKENSSKNNLVGLCPNHHRTLHDFRYKREIINILIGKGFLIPENKKLDFFRFLIP